MATRRPQLEDVLANVRRGRVVYLCLTPEQKRALRDPDGKIALDGLRHMLGARPLVPERFPLTEQAFQAGARRRGYVVGQKRCRRMVARLVEAGVIARAGALSPALPQPPRPLGLQGRPLQAGQAASRSPPC